MDVIRWIIFIVLFGAFILAIPVIQDQMGVVKPIQLIAPVPDPSSEYVLGIAWAAISKKSGYTEFIITDAGWAIDIKQDIVLLVEIQIKDSKEYWEVRVVWGKNGDMTARGAARIE